MFKERRAWCFLGPAAIIITLNWSIYIYAVSIDHIVETSLGYYINPLVTILLGLLIFKEHLTSLKWIAVGLCTVGIVYFTVSYGRFPLIGLLLALTFGVYGAIKKKGGYPAAEAITFESTVMVVPAVVMLLALLSITDSHAFLSDGTLEGIKTSLLLIGAGIATAVPLILFARAANLIPLTILGFIQYLSPTISLLIGVFVNHEAFTLAHAVCFGCIWGGLALVAIDSLFASKRSRSR